MISRKSCAGVSLQTHYLYLVVYITRYCNQYIFEPPVYNVLFKLFFIASSITIICLMLTVLRHSYEKRHDTFRISVIIILCIPFGYFLAPYPSIDNRLWAYSLWVEVFAILPQIVLFRRSKKSDILNRNYIFFLSIYRFFYLLNWIYKELTKTGRTAWVTWITGILQVLFYSDFVYEYIKVIITGHDTLDI